MAMAGAVASRSAVRTVMAAAAAPMAPTSLARELPRYGQKRLLSAGSNLLAEERKAAYFKKKEQEKIDKLTLMKEEENKETQMVPCSGNFSTPSSPSVANYLNNQKGRPSMINLMDCLENNEFDVDELKYAMRIIQNKCETNRTLIEMELSMENKALAGSDQLQMDYVTEVSKEAVLRAELQKARTEKEIVDER